MKGLTLTQKEQARLQVLNGILEGQISVDEAAEVLGVSERHVWRILAEYRKEGAAALAHGNRGRRANNSIPEEARTQVVALARTRYARVNHTHLTELLAEREEIVLGRSTVRRILVGAGMASPRRRRPPLHRVRRQRMSQEGMLVQVDGSVHAWLEERGPRCTLLLAIDDAISTVPYALFRHEEDTHGYFLLMQELIRRCGVPLALYSDRHAVFKYVPGSHQSPAPTQFGRAMAELGVEQIFARSPEAKGRVERANGTFQDRLVTELRLAGARTISEANQVLWAFLTRFNKRFGVPPAQSTNAYRSPDPDLNLAGILCFKHSRKVARDNTVKYNWHTLQLLPSSERSTYVGAHVVVQERLDGKLVVCYQNQIVPTQEAPPRPGVLRTLNATRGLGSVTVENLAAGMDTNGIGGHERERLGAMTAILQIASSERSTRRRRCAARHARVLGFTAWSARGPGPGGKRRLDGGGKLAGSTLVCQHKSLSKPNRPYPGSATASWCPPDSERHSRSWQRHRGEPRCRHGHQRDRWSRARKTGSDDRDRPGLAAGRLTTDRESEAVHPKAQPPRPPTPRQRARWKAVQRAKRRGLSLRAIARELGISRITVRKYVEASSPPVYPDRELAAHS